MTKRRHGVGVVSWICYGGMGWCDRWQREALDFCGATIRAGLVELRRIELEGAAALWQRSCAIGVIVTGAVAVGVNVISAGVGSCDGCYLGLGPVLPGMGCYCGLGTGALVLLWREKREGKKKIQANWSLEDVRGERQIPRSLRGAWIAWISSHLEAKTFLGC
ncbi:hypothetical protein M0R45_019750 [Rubus argutus]|uniref:Uncharacterized protein n=1 Tax=Rubus argutus TaxID=59490 RepID=A0AAW1X7W5_RUBAR